MAGRRQLVHRVGEEQFEEEGATRDSGLALATRESSANHAFAHGLAATTTGGR